MSADTYPDFIRVLEDQHDFHGLVLAKGTILRVVSRGPDGYEARVYDVDGVTQQDGMLLPGVTVTVRVNVVEPVHRVVRWERMDTEVVPQ